MVPASPLDAPSKARGSLLDPPTQLDLFDQQNELTLPNEKDLFRVTEVAEFLKCSWQQVANLIDAGDLETIAINEHVRPRPQRLHRRVTGRSLHAFINRRRKLAL